jgi:hypothetical protein
MSTLAGIQGQLKRRLSTAQRTPFHATFVKHSYLFLTLAEHDESRKMMAKIPSHHIQLYRGTYYSAGQRNDSLSYPHDTPGLTCSDQADDQSTFRDEGADTQVTDNPTKTHENYYIIDSGVTELFGSHHVVEPIWRSHFTGLAGGLPCFTA